jgi:two-component system alkaline phosphatase synthesis response regulator PhoP
MAKKILIIDDEYDPRTYLEVLFQEHGYDTATADDGDVALVKAREYKPDLITLDIIMPSETGVKFYRNLHKDKELAGTPVIICSGVTRYKELFARDHKTMPKPFAFIEKPIDKKLLLEKVKEAIG